MGVEPRQSCTKPSHRLLFSQIWLKPWTSVTIPPCLTTWLVRNRCCCLKKLALSEACCTRTQDREPQNSGLTIASRLILQHLAWISLEIRPLLPAPKPTIPSDRCSGPHQTCGAPPPSLTRPPSTSLLSNVTLVPSVCTPPLNPTCSHLYGRSEEIPTQEEKKRGSTCLRLWGPHVLVACL